MHLRHYATLASATALILTANPRLSFAIDTTIRDNQTVNSPQNLTGSGDTLTINARGNLETGPSAIVIGGSDARVHNRGRIVANDISAHGLHTTAANTSFINSGNLTTNGECGYGVYATGDYFTVVNNGIIATNSAYASYGIYVEGGNHSTIVNNDTISTLGDNSGGISIWGGSHTTISNHGRLTTAGDNSIGIYAWHTTGEYSYNVLTNTGTIRTAGANAQAIYANARGMTVINSGTVVSEQSEAIYMGRADQTLTLLQGSIIEGGIFFEQPDTATLNIGRGLNVSLSLNDIPVAIDTNGRPYVIDGNVLSVFDRASIDTANLLTTGAIHGFSNLVGNRLSGRRQGTSDGFTPLAYAPVASSAVFPDFAPSYDYGAWTNVYGSFVHPVGSSNADRANQGGAVFGFDARFDDGHVAGIFAGMGHGAARQTNGTKLDSTMAFAGGYGMFDLGPAFLEATMTVGATFNRSARLINNNMVAGGLETADGDYNGLFFSPSLTLGYDYEFYGARVSPSLSLLYAGIYQNGYTETGATANMTVGSQYTNAFVASGEFEIGTLRLDEMANGWSSSVTLGLEGTVIDGRDVNAAALGNALIFSGASTTEARGFIGADVGFSQGRYDVSARAELGYSSRGAISVNLQSGIRLAF